MSIISVNLKKVLKQLNPNIVLACETERHLVKNWPKYLESKWLRTRAEVKSDIYNEGRIKIVARLDEGRIIYHLTFRQTPIK